MQSKFCSLVFFFHFYLHNNAMYFDYFYILFVSKYAINYN